MKNKFQIYDYSDKIGFIYENQSISIKMSNNFLNLLVQWQILSTEIHKIVYSYKSDIITLERINKFLYIDYNDNDNSTHINITGLSLDDLRKKWIRSVTDINSELASAKKQYDSIGKILLNVAKNMDSTIKKIRNNEI